MYDLFPLQDKKSRRNEKIHTFEFYDSCIFFFSHISEKTICVFLQAYIQWVGWGKMSMVWQSESNDIFVSELKAKEFI